ncbi:MAG: multidrug effflux MFS transporter [Bacteroides sp.]|nr:multidrug effflux MFS transporter [Bacteroides sp.]MCM1413077.1 multidrug effflux MFS transporter [Bacteroides sp.]MCM1471783.1 multidrug effflux MFS transporter [Bacteroides sp.]
MSTQNNTSPVAGTTSSNGERFLAFLIFIAILGAFSSLVNDMYLPTMPEMRREFHTTASMTQMGLSMAMLGLGIGSVVWGSLSDHYGRKRMLLVSLTVFAVATAATIFTNSIGLFIATRLVQGIGAGGAMVLSYSIPADLYSGRQLAKVMALVGAINGIAPAASPLIGGFMADTIGWRGIFLVLLVIGVLMLMWSARRPESLPPDKRIPQQSIAKYAADYWALFKNRRFMLLVMLKAIGIGLLYAYISSAPFIFQDHYGFSAMEFGVIFGSNALAIALGAMLVIRFRVLKVGLVTGTVIMSVFAIAEALVMYHSCDFVWYEVTSLPMLLGSGMVFSAANSLGMEAGRSDSGTAGAILNVVKYIFAAIVAPLVGLGNIMHASAWCFAAVAVIAILFAIPMARLKPMADMTK